MWWKRDGEKYANITQFNGYNVFNLRAFTLYIYFIFYKIEGKN